MIHAAGARAATAVHGEPVNRVTLRASDERAAREEENQMISLPIRREGNERASTTAPCPIERAAAFESGS